MDESLFEKLNLVFANNLNRAKQYQTKRFIYDELKETTKKSKITLIKGMRGTGKTTVMLQLADELLKQGKRVFYITLDHLIFTKISFYDFIEYIHKTGVGYVFVDEIHKYPNWIQELKNIYDGFDLKIVGSSSNSLSLQKGKYDLARRVIDVELPHLSFREYLYLQDGKLVEPLSLEQIVKNWTKLQSEYKHHEIREYMKMALPFSNQTPAENYEKTLDNILEKIIYEDMLSYDFNTTSILHTKNILAYIALNPPGEVSISSVAANSSNVSKGTVAEVLKALEDIGVIKSVAAEASGKDVLRANKRYFVAPPFRWYLCRQTGSEPDFGSLREDFFVFHLFKQQLKYPAGEGEADFIVGDYMFEVGGKSKSGKQIKKGKNAFLVKDTPMAYDGIPLFLFGYLY